MGEHTMNAAGLGADAVKLKDLVATVMQENIQRLNIASTEAHRIFDKLPKVVQGLRSDNVLLVAEALSSQHGSLDCLRRAVKDACGSLEALKEVLLVQQAVYRNTLPHRPCLSNVGVAVCSLTAVTDIVLTSHAWSEGATAASQSPWTSWLTIGKGSLSTGKVHVASAAAHSFYIPGFLGCGVVAVACLGGLAKMTCSQARRLKHLNRLQDEMTSLVHQIQVMHDQWHSIAFTIDPIESLLRLVDADDTTHDIPWSRLLKAISTLIIAVDIYFAWLDLSGWVPASFPLQDQLRQRHPSGPCRHNFIKSMLSSAPGWEAESVLRIPTDRSK